MRLQSGWLFASMMVVLSGCASQVPAPIATAPPNNPRLAQVRAQPNDYQGLEVRWGGTIAAVENREQETVLLIVARPLDDDGRPQVDDAASQGRFMAKITGFLDPAIYTIGRSITVSGTVAGSESRKIGSYSYLYPVIAAEHYYLWPQPQQMARRYSCYDPFWYGPPFYPMSRFRYGYFGWGPYYACL